MKIKIVKWLIMFLWTHYKYLVLDVVIPAGKHLHRNPATKQERKFKEPVGQTHTARMAMGE